VRNVAFIGSGFKREQHAVLHHKLWRSEPNKKLENVAMRPPQIAPVILGLITGSMLHQLTKSTFPQPLL